MTYQVGDRVVVEAESTERRPRAGTIREVLREDPNPRPLTHMREHSPGRMLS